MKKPIASLVFLLFSVLPALSETLQEPKLHLPPSAPGLKRVALTFDACTGQTDERILQALIDNHIAATIFATGRWIRRNPQAAAEIKSHPELFEVENHGAMHLPAIDVPTNVYGIAAAGSARAVRDEVTGGAQSVKATFGNTPTWFRGATGLYTASSEQLIASMHYKIAGYSLIGDGGAAFLQTRTAKIIGNAKDGDVIIAHINQPTKPAGAGVVEGLLKLKAEGFSFVKLQDEFAN